MPDDNFVVLDSIQISQDSDSFEKLKQMVENLLANGYSELKIDISGDPRLRAAQLNYDLVLFDKILEIQKLPPAIITEFMTVKSALVNNNFIERIDFEW